VSANWQKIGGLEVCEGTDGVVGIVSAQEFMRRWDRHGQELPSFSSQDAGFSMRDKFEKYHCQPLHEIEECADGSVFVKSVEYVDGKPKRGCGVRAVASRWWAEFAMVGRPDAGPYASKAEAIAAAVAYVSAR
jgi:hypothetical protein